jgi:pimeloyl-ACP methyl ester carboxylesterase
VPDTFLSILRMILRLRLITVCAVAVLAAGCGSFVADPEYRATRLPDDVTELFEVPPVAANPDADTVWIFEQGGPSHEITYEVLIPFLSYRGHEDIHLVQVHQTLTLNHELAARHAPLSFANLQAEVDVSVEILRRVIDHFKSQGKRVVVVGYSYGSFLVARYLALQGPAGADRYVMMAGRLDMPQRFVEGALAGMLYHFPNAADPELVDRRPTTDREFIELRMAGATFHDRYTERLAATDLHQAVYVYGTADTVVGRLSDAEVRFLEENGSTVIVAEGANHYSLALDQTVLDRIHDALQEQP